ncbi:hypothetical protein FE783_23330 [Paenibacillus mesophilus]|uniref:hypothetical protein n=1 Tax=Paenibacillus mesophilus TaxID=2582849 RepID=UPI00110F522D|nr:hypothetical protein [Paenibacillus mesophilus]TMV47175.1 hypothetical protein FE783_23330 [Paenibacillus mesophilus]
MSPDYEIRERTLVLADTCLEGLTHMQWQMQQGYYESSLTLYCDVLDAIHHIERSVHLSIEVDYSDRTDGWFAVQEQLCERLDEMAEAFRARRFHLLPPLLARLVPVYRLWHNTVHLYLNPNYVV